MAATCFELAPYTLDFNMPVPWPPSSISAPGLLMPATTRDESPLACAKRRCAETLWLPESVMSLNHLVRSLRQPKLYTHTALDPLLGSARAIANTFQNVLPSLLEANDPSAGEAAMWTAWRAQPDGTDPRAFLDKIEQREVQIQVLLYMLNLTLPPAPETPSSSSTPSRKRKRAAADPLLSLDERLEFFMDKLSLWQLTASLVPLSGSQPSSSQPSSSQHPEPDDNERDWTQVFCEDVVEPLFKDVLPEQCELLRSKLFRVPPIERDASRSPSPTFSRASSRGPTPAPVDSHPPTRATSPLRLAELKRFPSRGPSIEPKPKREPSIDPISSSSLAAVLDKDRQSSRSRSRSVSLAADEMSERGASRGGIVSSRALFRNREVPVRATGSSSALSRRNSASSSTALSKTKVKTTTTTTTTHMVVDVDADTEMEVLVPDTPARRVKVEEKVSAQTWIVPESPGVEGSPPLQSSPAIMDSSPTPAGRDAYSDDDDDEGDGAGLGLGGNSKVLAFQTPTRPKRR
ncbi:hypothetical protein EXIGLDRAFT_747145 [Exidia glandulosa HHB12029]|uniref:DNA replication regulator Sld3 C-terminal domain-containing protein n=1 Tax=Exidia glandulosa HHB12029 TaxID=1314781 RepID=A0A165L5G1_EXIGL|nr:hypothetical protein EXIGLDRAFT_747145 [Exidia glandulosa HHB12029]